MKMKRFIAAVVLVVVAGLSTGCMTYRDFPVDMVGKAPVEAPYKKISYKIDKFEALSLGGGEAALKEALRKRHPFQDADVVEDMPKTGLFYLVTVEQKPVSLSVLAAGYLSYSTLGILPAWSTKDGFVIRYDLFVNGEKTNKYEYEVTRKSAVWLGLLPFIWVNLLTYSEADAIQATAYQFFKEAGPVFASYQPAL